MQINPTLESTFETAARCIARNAADPRRHWYFTLVRKDTQQIIGTITLYADLYYPENIGTIGYTLAPVQWGNGYMTEAVRAVTTFAHKTLRMHRVEISTDTANERSWRVAERAGFIREATQSLRHRNTQGWSDADYLYVSLDRGVL